MTTPDIAKPVETLVSGSIQDGVQVIRSDQIVSKASPVERREKEKRRLDGFSLGTPITAAFVGGFLVLESVMGADQEGGRGVLVDPFDDLIGDSEDGDALDELPSGASASQTSSGASSTQDEAEQAIADAGSEEVSAQQFAGGGQQGAAMPAITTANDAGLSVDDTTGGGANANLNLFNINVSNGELDSEIEPIVEDEVISRRREVGTPGDDVLIGTDGDDEIIGAAGDDIIRGEGGSDVLRGNEGNDQLFGGTGRDRLDGGSGNDILDGGNDGDLDLLRGGLGDDIFFVNGLHDVALERDSGAYAADNDLIVIRQGYADELPSGTNSATFVYADNYDTALPEGAAAKRQTLSPGIEDIRLEGSADHDIFADGQDNVLTGNDGANLIDAGGGDDQVLGGAGDDRLIGGDGDDEIRGGSGNDVIEGGLGRDMLYGEAGNDVFVIGMNDSAIDTVFDHEGVNSLRLEGVGGRNVEASVLENDLIITVDDTPVARVESYVGHESAFSGIDFGQGLQSMESLLGNHDDLEGAVADAEARAAELAGDDLLAAHLHMSEPTVLGSRHDDRLIDGTDGDDWLSGFGGRDTLFGRDGDDILEGGDGGDKLLGGAGDDRYVFSSNENGIDIIRDHEGRNLAELKGFDHAKVEGAMFNDDLRVVADGDLIFVVEDFAQHQANFVGVQAGNRFIPTDDLLA